MAALERVNEPLGPDDVAYLKAAVSYREINHVCTVSYEPEGWHVDLYYDRDDIQKRLPIVSDVHTQPTFESPVMVISPFTNTLQLT